jgi:hypothetical protein
MQSWMQLEKSSIYTSIKNNLERNIRELVFVFFFLSPDLNLESF